MNEEQMEGMLLMATHDTNSIDARRSSTGEAATRASSSQSNSEGKIIPHYLRSSTGSCHDFCKYGRKHTFESKGRNPTFPRYLEKGQNQVPSLGEKQKKPAVKQKRAALPETGLYDRPKTSEEKAFSPSKTVKPIQEGEISKHGATCHERSGSSESQNECNFPSSSKQIDALRGFRTIKQVAHEKIASYDDAETTTQDNPASLKKTEASTETQKRKLSPHKVHLSPEPSFAEQRNQSARKIFASAKSKVEQKTPPVKKTNSSGKAKFSKQVSPSPANRFDASARPVLPGKSNVTFVKSESQLKPATGMTGRNIGGKLVKHDLSLPRGKKILKSPLDSLSPQPPANHVSKSASPVNDAKKVKKSIHKPDKIREKPFHIIGQGPTDNESTKSTQSKSNSCQPSPSSSSLSSSPLTYSSVSGHEEEEYPDSESLFSEACDLDSDDGTSIAAQIEDKKSQREMAIVHTEYKDQIPYKLRFRRGKMLDTPSDDSDTKRLRFRQGGRMGDIRSGEGEVNKINFKIKELTCGESSQPDPEGQAVVLRHQDVQDKKDTVSLFNHVIEETASKLVETRKSKVKALVGAFETVISLQERKPSTSV